MVRVVPLCPIPSCPLTGYTQVLSTSCASCEGFQADTPSDGTTLNSTLLTMNSLHLTLSLLAVSSSHLNFGRRTQR